MHEISIGSAAPSLRDAAEVDKLKLTLASLQEQGLHEKTQMEARATWDIDYGVEPLNGEMSLYKAFSMALTTCYGCFPPSRRQLTPA